MEIKIVDARGQVCPKPLIMTRKALQEIGKDQGLQIILDNETSKNNVERFLLDNGMKPAVTGENGTFTIAINTPVSGLKKPDVESYCSPGTKTGHVVVISSDKMGTGPDELGTILMKAFINTIQEIDPLPATIVFYNTGVLLTVRDSPVLESLNRIETAGVKVLVCGTCADYFKIKDTVKAGTISNMYTIMEALTSARSVIYP